MRTNIPSPGLLLPSLNVHSDREQPETYRSFAKDAGSQIVGRSEDEIADQEAIDAKKYQADLAIRVVNIEFPHQAAVTARLDASTIAMRAIFLL
jgi:hypothetical protein